MSVEKTKMWMDRVFYDTSVPIETVRQRLLELVEYARELEQNLGEAEHVGRKRVCG